jgi:MYXO-CTERM domain-containing protein
LLEWLDMKALRLALVAGVTALSTLSMLERVVLACADPPADPVLACSDSVKVPFDSDVPSNLPAFYWAPTFALSEIDKAGGRLVRVDGPAPEQIPFQVRSTVGGVWVQPDVALVPGASYTFTRTASCHFGTNVTREVTTAFKGGAAATLGKSFGIPKVSAAITKETAYTNATSACGSGEVHPVTARSVTISPSDAATIAAALPFVPVYAVRLDGDASRAYGVPGEGGLELQAYCGPAEEVASSPIAPGKHTVQLYSAYPGSDGFVFSDVTEIDLSCPSSSTSALPSAGSGGGCSATSGSHASGAGVLALAALGLVVSRARRRPRD